MGATPDTETTAPQRSPSVVDLLARQTLAIADQVKAMDAGLDALASQVNCLLEAVRVLQDAEAQRRAAAAMRAEDVDRPPAPPPVFGQSLSASSVAAPSLPPVPPAIPR